MKQLGWLPEAVEWRARLRALANAPEAAWPAAVGLANSCLDFIQTNALDEAVRRIPTAQASVALARPPLRLAILGSSTTAHLHAPIRVAGLRRNLLIETFEPEYGQYLQAVNDPESALHTFKPDVVLFALDSHHIARSAADASPATAGILTELTECWRRARDTFGCQVLQQTFLDVHPPLMGSNEHRLSGSASSFVFELNHALRHVAQQNDVDLVAVDRAAAAAGLRSWHDPALWCRAKQEISPAAGPAFGEMVVRVVAARLGLSRKCLVLDLDNTLWGGVIGDDGLDGLVLGQGSPLGEGFLAVQAYARGLSRRGIILAVCSKNDDLVAREVFERHPEMILRLADISAFRANWNDKASNLREIAAELNIGLDSLVFLDDNPFEREQVRRELPMVSVPEIPDEPALVPQVLAEAGYFESVAITDDDRARTLQYQANRERQALSADVSDMDSYLRSLHMRMQWSRFDSVGLQRIVQLINKTNQFNLTTRRYSEADIRAIMADAEAFGVQIRLLDRFGDNGIIAIVIGRLTAPEQVTIDTWLMSCRVLGRQVEVATLNVVAALSRELGARRLVGEYYPTARNGMVKDHYARLGFTQLAQDADGRSRAVIDLTTFAAAPTFIEIAEG